MNMVPDWSKKLPSSNRKKAETGGYTKPDRAVRCKKCFVGVDECGGGVGTPIAVYIVSAELPRGGSVAVARVPMCYKCRTVLPFVILDGGRQLGITGPNIVRCLKASRGFMFNLDELLTGEIQQANALPDIAPKPIIREDVVDPENMTREQEEQAVSLF